MLPINESLTFAACTDGTANCIIVGECSDYYYQTSGSNKVRQNPAPSQGLGWLVGNNLPYASGIAQVVKAGGTSIGASSVANLISVAHPVGINNRITATGIPNWNASGIGTRGPNNPLLAASGRRDGGLSRWARATRHQANG